MKIKKRTKSSRMHGRGRGTHGYGERKKHKKTGHRGGKGMSGSGKRADHKKTLVLKKYGHKYFGKQGITSRGTKRDIKQRINLQQIELNLEKYGKKIKDTKNSQANFGATKSGTVPSHRTGKDFVGKWEIDLKNYKILGTREVKNKLIINAKEVSKSARTKVERADGQIILTCPPKRGRTKAGGEIVLRREKEKKERVEKKLGKKQKRLKNEKK